MFIGELSTWNQTETCLSVRVENHEGLAAISETVGPKQDVKKKGWCTNRKSK